jgi:hypothetical protein
MPGEGSFDERIRFLEDAVGDGNITAGVDVDQPYAQDQHETPYRHRKGQMKYLSEPLFANIGPLMSKIANEVITEEGSNLSSAMRDTADEMAEYVADNAPVDTGRLSESASPYVREGLTETYRRPAIAPREEDEAPRFLRRGGQ